MTPELISAAEAASICGTSRNTIYRWLRRGVLEKFREGGRTFVRRQEVENYMKGVEEKKYGIGRIWQICSLDGCSNTHAANGMCVRHYCAQVYHEKKIQMVAQFDDRCQDCLRGYPLEVFEFDYVGKDPKNHTAVSILACRGAAWERIAAELAECEMVCSNCHKIRTQERRKEYGSDISNQVQKPARKSVSIH